MLGKLAGLDLDVCEHAKKASGCFCAVSDKEAVARKVTF